MLFVKSSLKKSWNLFPIFWYPTMNGPMDVQWTNFIYDDVDHDVNNDVGKLL
jgi:hypothetical protein